MFFISVQGEQRELQPVERRGRGPEEEAGEDFKNKRRADHHGTGEGGIHCSCEIVSVALQHVDIYIVIMFGSHTAGCSLQVKSQYALSLLTGWCSLNNVRTNSACKVSRVN